MFLRLTPVLKTLLLLNGLIFVLDSVLGSGLHKVIIGIFALQPIESYFVYGVGEISFYPWQLITYQFLHGGFSHLFFNLFALWMFASELEERWGSAKFLVYYLLSGIGAGLVHMLVSYELGSMAPTIGASGSIYGVIIGYALLYPDRKLMIFPIFIPIPARIFAFGMMGISVVLGIFSLEGGVAHFAHFGGALTGILLLKFGEKTPIFKVARKYLKFGMPSNEYTGSYGGNVFGSASKKGASGFNAFWSKSDVKQSSTSSNKRININSNDFGGQKVTQDTLDAILDKISSSGYASLTEQEKYILNELSKKL
ncbi:MAG: rhomboid family intramembrane serine protease [Ignavibacteria bacterium]|jgi:membrane associated rhomboid family serine protease|nr:rhomboid family intramembrane serine protease [Ignavibacteria bacterium]